MTGRRDGIALLPPHLQWFALANDQCGASSGSEGQRMSASADIVVAGAGHNSLLTACYLAKAGYRCLVLDARSIPGGGAATEELLLPGFAIDTCATGHTIIPPNPPLLPDQLVTIAA